MESDALHGRYRSRVLREMNANRENPFNSPPSSTGSHGTVSPTMSSVFSDPDGESTRRLNEDIARLVNPNNGRLQVDLEAAHRKWPEFYAKPKNPEPRAATKTNGSLRHKENVSHKSIVQKYLSTIDDTEQDTWQGSKRTRAEMQPRVDNDSDLSSNMSKSPFQFDINAENFRFNPQQQRHQSPLAKGHARTASGNYKAARRASMAANAERRKSDFLAPPTQATPKPEPVHSAPAVESTPVTFNTIKSHFPSPATTDSPAQNNVTCRSFFMPDISHLNDFITGKLRFDGGVQNGVPVFVKNGRVRNRIETQPPNDHAEVDGLAIPPDEENLFVSLDMIRDEICNLQEHDDLVQRHALALEEQVVDLKNELKRLKGRKSIDSAIGSRTASEPETAADERYHMEKLQLESQMAALQSRLEQATTRIGVSEAENNTLSLEKDRAVKKLQEACVNIGDLMDKIETQERALHETQERLNATLEINHNREFVQKTSSFKQTSEALQVDNKSLQADNKTLRQEQETLQREMEELRADNNSLRREQESLISENRSLRSNARSLMTQNEELRQTVENAKEDIQAAHEEVEALQVELQTTEQEHGTLKEDNDSLVRHNEKYFNENKILRRENSGFEKSLHDLHDENIRLKEEIEYLKQQLDHCRPLGKTEEFSARLNKEVEDDDDEEGENMTSAFFMPDITIDSTQNSRVVDVTAEEKATPKRTPSKRTIEVTETTEQTDRSMNDQDTIQSRRSSVAESRPKRRPSASRAPSSSQKVAFSLPEGSASNGKNSKASNLANKGSKRSSNSHTTSKSSVKGASVPDLDPFQSDDEGTIQSPEHTQTHSMVVDVKSRKEGSSKSRTVREETTNTTRNLTSQSQRSVSLKPAVKSSQNKSTTIDLMTQGGLDNTTTEMKGNCPGLSPDARRVLDTLSGHSCKNCIVCTRIKAHRGTVTAADIAEGKKRIKVSRPVPPSEQYKQLGMSTEDNTVRPSQPPGHALAKVIQGLRDELEHMKMEAAKMQARYDRHNPALSETKRKQLFADIQVNRNQQEVKNGQIYALYDVAEGQKQAGQDMSEEELDVTVFSITGLSVRDITDQVTWEGISA
ncbi:rhoptry protein [Colletotrichum karsti]|uniref:Rhoptry protein n=1 Tax=Colletotrichum karsti TaxID=1095194 RepID=A0A9P6LJI4_9PEZI|nr:rhoptry protein [Colletotrichum karsti]KAF9875713.1 rhoptry protein [Colletotrichum karsti]